MNHPFRASRFRHALTGLKTILAIATLALSCNAFAAIDLVINVDSDKTTYKSTDTQTFTVTVTNNGPDTALNSQLSVNHPVAGLPFEATASCVALGGAVCPASGSYTGLPGMDLKATLPSIPSQGTLIVTFQVVPPLGCRFPLVGGAMLQCQGAPTYETGRVLITANVTNIAADGRAATNTANTNIALYAPTLGFKMVITSAPTTTLAPGNIATFDFEIQSQGQDPTGPLTLDLSINSNVPSPAPPAGFSGFLPGSVLQDITCLSATPAPGAALPATVFLSGNACGSGITLPTPGPSTILADGLRGFPSTNFVNLPGTLTGGGVAKFRATVKVGTPRCFATGVNTVPVKFTVNSTGPVETLPYLFADNSQSVSFSVATTCQEADIKAAVSVLPTTNVKTTSTNNNTYTLSSTVSNISSGVGAGTATNVPFTIGSGDNPFYLGPISVGTTTCVPSGGAVCPAAGAYTVSPAGASTTKKVDGLIPSLPPGGAVVFTTVFTTGSIQPLCNFVGFGGVRPLVQAGTDATLADPNYTTVLPTLGNNRAQTQVLLDADGSTPNVAPCVSSGGGGTTTPPAAQIDVVKTGPFANAGGGALIGQSSGAFVAPGSTAWFRIVLTNNGSTSVNVGTLTDSGSYPTTSFSTGGFRGTIATPASWGVLCAVTGSATCFDTVTPATAGAYQNFIALGYAGGAKAAIAPGATVTVDIPFVVPAPNLPTAGVCVTKGSDYAFADFEFGGVAGSKSTAGVTQPELYYGYSACDTKLGITKSVAAPATSSNIPVSGVVSFNIVVSNLSTTQSIGRPRLIDIVSLNAAASATMTVTSITCSPTAGAALCPPASSLIAGSAMPAGTAIGATDIDITWGSAGASTMPPSSAVTFVVTYALNAPKPAFSGLSNVATVRADNEPLAWGAQSATAFISVPTAPIISVQKRVATQIVATGGTAFYTVDVVNAGGSAASNVLFIDNLPAALIASNPTGYSVVACTNISATMPTPQGTVTCPTSIGTATGLNFTIASLPPNTALRFTYQAKMPASEVSVENFVTVAPGSSSGGGSSFTGGTAGAHANVQVLAAAPPPPPPDIPVVQVPTVNSWMLGLIALLLALTVARRRSRF